MSVTSLLYQTFIIGALFAIRVAGDKACYGTSHSGNTNVGIVRNYEDMRTMYTNCTHVYTNLEITNLRDINGVNGYDLSFLKDIRYVGGYVLIRTIDSLVSAIPLNNLEVIRGNHSYYYRSTNRSYTLAVINTGIINLQMGNLEEISQGNVLFNINPQLRHVDNIKWQAIQKDPNSNVTFINDGVYNATAQGNPAEPALNCPEMRGWSRDPLLCQKGLNNSCHSDCNGRCYSYSSWHCCHSTCAIGCTGKNESQCTVCKDYKRGQNCVGFCPADTINRFPRCAPMEETQGL